MGQGGGEQRPTLKRIREKIGSAVPLKVFCLQGNRQFHVPWAIQLYLRQVYKWGDEETMRGCELQALPKLQGRFDRIGTLSSSLLLRLGSRIHNSLLHLLPSHQADTIFNTKKVYKSQLTVTASVQQAHINTTVLVWLGSVWLFGWEARYGGF